ncbi:MAG: CocE/NonD family hydrolase [Rhodobacteraceae bacterium]|nr:CocE/NonD family hydrolase [Paracoccaceae bacterium]
MTTDIIEFADMAIPLADGTRLSARVWMPVDADQNPVPAILEYLPYRKRDGTAERDALTHPYFAARGYACLRVDIRGNGESEGIMTDEYTPQELSDACEVIAWIAAQDWCSGNVGMMGISWGGFNGLQVAALQPDALKAVITLCSTADRFADDIHYKGGCLLNENLGWAATMLSFSSRPPDPDLVGEKWRDMWFNRLNADTHLAEIWLEHQSRDEYWKHGSVCEDYSAIKAAVLAVGGWGDAYKNTVPALVENLSAPVKGIIGPWVHKYPHFAAPEPRIGFLQEALRWWDRWLKDIDTGVEDDPDLRLYLMDSVPPKSWYHTREGRWVDQRRPKIETFILGDDGLAKGAYKFAKIIDSPQDCGAMSGEYCAIWLGPEMPGDQRGDDALSVCFDSDPLENSVDIVGASKVSLTIRSKQPTGNIAVRLCDIHPNGASTRITYGVLNLTHRDGSENPVSMPVDTPITIDLNLDHIAYRLPKGHRLRVAISNSYWPLIWPSPHADPLVLEGGNLMLPLLNEGDKTADNFASPASAEPQKTETLRDSTHVRRQEINRATGEVKLIIKDDFGKIKDLSHGLITAEIAREIWAIHPDDPLSARGETHWTQELWRDNWHIRTETKSAMYSDAEKFYLTATVIAFENEKQVFENTMTKTIKRQNL